MARAVAATLIFLIASAWATSPKLRASFSQFHTSDAASMHSKEVMEWKIQAYKAINPGFSEESCTAMYEKVLRTGGAAPAPNDFVVGCDPVCTMAREIKEYWGLATWQSTDAARSRTLAAFTLARP